MAKSRSNITECDKNQCKIFNFVDLCSRAGSIQACSQPSDDGGGRFLKILDLDLLQSLKIGVSSGCLKETSIFKIIMIDDVTLSS